MFPFAFWRREPESPETPGVTINEGKWMRLKTPFDQIAIYDSHIDLKHSGSSARLMIHKNGKSYLSQIMTEPLDG